MSLQKSRSLFLLSFFVLCILSLTPIYHADDLSQNLPLPTPVGTEGELFREITDVTNTSEIPTTSTTEVTPELTNAVLQAYIDARGIIPERELWVDITTAIEGWVLGISAIPAPPVEYAMPEDFLFLAQQTTDGWIVYIEGTPEFYTISTSTPVGLLSDDVKANSFDVADGSMIRGDGSWNMSLPFATGQQMSMTVGPYNAASISSETRPWNALVFGGGSTSQITAAQSGTVYLPCANMVRLDIGGNSSQIIRYYFLDGIQVSNGQSVSRGQNLGQRSMNAGCGGSVQGGPIVQFAVYNCSDYASCRKEITGLDIGGYTVESISRGNGCLRRIANPGEVYCGNLGSSPANVPNYGEIGTPRPSTPTNPTTNVISSTQINLSWTDTSGNESGFGIERHSGNGNWIQVTTLPTNTTSYSDTSLACDISYTYRVYAYLGSLPSEYSSEATSRTWMCAPASITAQALNQTQATASYTNSVNSANFYRIERAVNGVAPWILIADLPTGTNFHKDVTLMCGNNFTYRVQARRNNGQFSDFRVATTISTQPCMFDKALLIDPVDQQEYLLASARPTFRWSLVYSAAWYRIQVRDSDEDLDVNKLLTPAEANCSNGVCSYTPPSNLTGDAYTWSVVATSSSNQKARSDEWTFYVVSVYSPQIISPIGTISASNGHVAYTWVPVATAVKYKLSIYVPRNSTTPWFTILLNAADYCNVTLCTFTPSKNPLRNYDYLHDNGNYRWKIQAREAINRSKWDTANFSLQVPKPAMVTITSPSANSTRTNDNVIFTFSEVQNVYQYVINVTGGPTAVDNMRFYRDDTAKLNCNGSTCTTVLPIQLKNGTYQITARGVGSGGNGPLQALPHNFTVNAPLPASFNQLRPNNTQAPARTELWPIFEWQLSPNAISYRLIVRNAVTDEVLVGYPYTVNVCSPSKCSVGSSTIPGAAKFLDDKRYEWRLVAENFQGTYVIPTWWEFKMDLVPSEIQLYTPRNTTQITNPKPFVDWYFDQRFTEYRIYFSKSLDLDIILDDTIVSNRYTPWMSTISPETTGLICTINSFCSYDGKSLSKPLSDQTRYYWVVVGRRNGVTKQIKSDIWWVTMLSSSRQAE